MYTRSGPVTNAATIHGFLSRYVFVPKFVFNTGSQPFTPLTYLTIQKKNATIRSGSSVVEAEVVEKSDTEFDLIEKDSAQKTGYSGSHCNELQDNLFLPRIARNCYSVAVGGNTSQLLCKYRQAHPLRSENGQLYIPLVTWLITYKNVCGYGSTNTNLVFNSTYANYLQKGIPSLFRRRRRFLLNNDNIEPEDEWPL